jgi:hypothetical protein
MAILGGSPLGLIGVRSTPVQGTGMSTFNGGNSRNINVNKYNSAINPNPKKKGTESLLSGKTTLSPYGNIGMIGTENGGGQGMDKSLYGGVNKNTLHNNAVYDTSLLNIIERLSGTEAALRPGDFAYLKDVGVYPNNRLMIARRFLSPHGDNIYGKAGSKVTSIPTAVLISWKGLEDDFIDIQFGEDWGEANADFTNVLNDLGKDFGMSGGLSLGSMGNAGFNIVSLPGFTETLQREVLTKMGILSPDGAEQPLPSGNPNLIKVAKRRKTIGYETAGSGLKCIVNIKMTCEWEQKFISGIDPTIVFQDLISTVLRFGTSKSDVYGLSKAFEDKVKTWLDNPERVGKDFIEYITNALGELKDKLVDAVSSFFGSQVTPKEDKNAAAEADKKNAMRANKEGPWGSNAIVEKAIKGLTDTLRKTIQKYRLEIEGIAHALSGMPSTPWHITIGNPLRPTFCAGDMYMADNMTLKLGPNLAFNDLPSSIIAEFTLTNARPWGLQEIMAKFNAGSLRVSNGLKDTNSLKPGESINNGKTEDGEAYNDTGAGTASNTGTASIAGNSAQSSTSNVRNPAEQRPTIDNVAVAQVGPLSEEQAKTAALTKDAPTFLNGFNGGDTGLPSNPSTSLAQVNNSATQVTGTLASSQTNLSGLNSNKLGEAGEQINKDATSTIAVTLQNIDFSRLA